MACGQSNRAIIQIDVFDITSGLGIGLITWWYNKYYNNIILKKATM